MRAWLQCHVRVVRGARAHGAGRHIGCRQPAPPAHGSRYSHRVAVQHDAPLDHRARPHSATDHGRADIPTIAGPSVILHQLNRRFGSTQVVRDLSIELLGPAIHGIVGPNGCGKTSVLRMIAQLLEPDSGAIHVCGVPITGGAAIVRRWVGYVPHEPMAWTSDSVRLNLQRAWSLLGGRDSTVVSRSIAEWGLTSVAEQPVGALSRGWAQRYSLARADLAAPPVLVLDEPTVGLDDTARAHLNDALARWAESRLVIVTSHERAWVTDIAHTVHDFGAIGA